MPAYRYIPPAQKDLLVTVKENTGHSNIQLAAMASMGKRTIERTMSNKRLYDSVVPPKKGQVGRPRATNGLDEFYLEGLVQKTPDITLDELRDELFEATGADVDKATISRILKRRGYTFKKTSVAALERNEDTRNDYTALIGDCYSREMLVFLDESHCDRRSTRRKGGWAPSGQRARRHDFFVRGTKYSVLPAISLDGVLHLDIIARSWTSEDFEQYIETLLDNMNRYPFPNSVIVMDNASTHHFEGIRDIIEGRGMRLVYLPPYSPDFNPIEEGFSAMKAWLRRNRDFALGELGVDLGTSPIAMLWDAVFESMTPESIEGWFADCHY